MSTARLDGIPECEVDDPRSFDLAAYRAAIGRYGMFLARFSVAVDVLALVRELGNPHAHDADGILLWNVRPTIEGETLARSLTDLPFPLHTDCSFEEPPPRYLALHAIRVDREGGGRSLFLDSRELIPSLHESTMALLRGPYPIEVPAEFRKGVGSSVGAIFLRDREIRYRRDCIIDDACTAEQLAALHELDALIAQPRFRFTTEIPEGAVLFVDNRRILHGRTRVRDRGRHLQRVRYF